MKWLRFLGIGLLIFCLIGVRAAEETLFYDPFLAFFKTDFRNANFPSYDGVKLVLSHIFRYWLNAGISLLIIHLLFQKKKYTYYSFWLFLGVFIIVSVLYALFIGTEFSWGYTAGFYVRRFLIQPVLILIFVPALWYFDQTHQSKS